MKRTAIAIAAIGAMALATAACGSGGSSSAKSDSITVWLQTDAQTLWPQAVTDATTAFHQENPNVKVNVQYQAWTDHLTKFDATVQAHTAPDVIEFGNSETAQYIANGALVDLSSQQSTFDNSTTWLDGLTQSCTSSGKLFCVPYYGGDRAVTYRKDMFAAAGITTAPASWDELLTDVQHDRGEAQEPTRTSPRSTCPAHTRTAAFRSSSTRAARSPRKPATPGPRRWSRPVAEGPRQLEGTGRRGLQG